jgi:hypothetical protein
MHAIILYLKKSNDYKDNKNYLSGQFLFLVRSTEKKVFMVISL